MTVCKTAQHCALGPSGMTRSFRAAERTARSQRGARTTRSLRLMIASAMACLVSIVCLASTATAAPDWDRAANVKAAAQQIGEIQSRGGAEQAFKFITACYKTHGLASKYAKAFEGCIAQDVMLMHALSLIYARVDPAILEKNGAPSPETLQRALNQRVSGAFAQYDIPISEARVLEEVIREHGMPVFVKLAFPNSGPAPSKAK